MPLAPLLAALLAPGLLCQDATVPPADPPAPADRPAAKTPESADEHGTLKLPPTGGERPTADRPDLAETAKRITDRTNEFRKQHDLPPVSPDDTLAEAATKYGELLARESLFGHRAGGTTPAERVSAVGYDYCSVRENLAVHFDSFGFRAEKLAEESVTGWINSPGHRANLLADNVSETGVGVVRDSESGRYFSVQLFAHPKRAAVAFEVENRTTDSQTYRSARRNTRCRRVRAEARQLFPRGGAGAVGAAPAEPSESATPSRRTGRSRWS